ncbi:MAG: glycine cleavage system protein GcvH [Candidatus Heimdallarchaeota archaeon]|nr:glycine cleavage system protein GcvH [Candidatus Heimdallarchaeota archaeon]
MKLDPDARYADTHEWAKKDGDLFVVGITDYAQGLLKDIVFVEMPSEGSTFQKGEKVCEIESVKAVAELKMPISGEIVEINEELEDDAEPINDDPYGDGWFFKVKASNPDEFNELLSPEEYEKVVEEEKDD